MKTSPTRSLAAAALAISLSLAGCGPRQERTLHVFTWADYIDPDLVAQFERANACRVVIDTFDSNETMYAKLKAGASGYDVITPSSYMARTMWEEGMLDALDHAALPSLRHVDPKYLERFAIDREMRYSVPYMLSTTGLGYRASRVQGMEPSWAALDRPDVRGRVTLLNDMRETIGAALKSLGLSLNTTSDADLGRAREVLLRWKRNIAKFESEQYKPGVASGEFLVVHGYSGDIFQAQEEEEDVAYAIPREGASVACDDLVVPKNARQKPLAHALIDFLTEPAHAATNAKLTCYLPPNSAAYPLLDPEIRENPGIFVPEEILQKCEVIRGLAPADLQKYQRLWDQIKSANP